MYCAKRDTAYTYLTSTKPTTNKNGDYECMDASMGKLCGTSANKFEHVFCIPTASECPITKVSVADGKLVPDRDVAKGTPLVTL